MSATKTNRRRFVIGAVGSFISASRSRAQNTNSLNPGPSSFRVTVSLNGETYSYPDGPKIPSYFVGFREDGRVVFHLGALGQLGKKRVQPAPYHLGPHHVKIEKDGVVLFEINVQAHWWNAEWTFRPAKLTPKKTPAQIVAANRMFSFGNIGARIGETAKFTYKGPMDSAGITIYMPTTGERPDIGLITDPSANFMLTGNGNSMLAWAQT